MLRLDEVGSLSLRGRRGRGQHLDEEDYGAGEGGLDQERVGEEESPASRCVDPLERR